MQHELAQQHATPTRGPPRNALVRFACCSTAACEFHHAHAKIAAQQIQTNSTCKSLLRNEFEHANELASRRARVACLQSTRRGRVSPPCRAKPPRTRRRRGSGTTRTDTKSAREAPVEPKKPSRLFDPTSWTEGQLSFRHRHPHVPCRPKPRRGNRGDAKASFALMCAYAWKTSVH